MGLLSSAVIETTGGRAAEGKGEGGVGGRNQQHEIILS